MMCPDANAKIMTIPWTLFATKVSSRSNAINWCIHCAVDVKQGTSTVPATQITLGHEYRYTNGFFLTSLMILHLPLWGPLEKIRT